MRPKVEVADIFRRHGDAFRAAQGNRLSHEQLKVMAAIEACRTQALGGHVERCEDCGVTRIAFNSCRDRHCPKCQGLARLQWLAHRPTDLPPLPATYRFKANSHDCATPPSSHDTSRYDSSSRHT